METKTMKCHEQPGWIVLNMSNKTQDEIVELMLKYELIVEKNGRCIYFYGHEVKLLKQEILFLKRILTYKRKIKYSTLMKSIKSKCKEENMQDFAYRVANKIKSKITNAYIKDLSDPMSDMYKEIIAMTNEIDETQSDEEKRKKKNDLSKKEKEYRKKLLNNIIDIKLDEDILYRLNADNYTLNCKFDLKGYLDKLISVDNKFYSSDFINAKKNEIELIDFECNLQGEIDSNNPTYL